MAFRFPYTNFHALNLDWIIGKIKEIANAIPTKVSQLENDSGYITSAQSGAVNSVNGMTGDVVLNIPTKTSELTNDSGFVTQEVVIFDYDTVTNADVATAYHAGKVVLIDRTSVANPTGQWIYILALFSSDTSQTFFTVNANVMRSITLDNNAWSFSSREIPVASTALPQALGTAAVGTGTSYARSNHVHPMPSAADVGALADDALNPSDSASMNLANIAEGVTVRAQSYSISGNTVTIKLTLNVTTALSNGAVIGTTDAFKIKIGGIICLGRSASTGNLATIEATVTNTGTQFSASGNIAVGDWIGFVITTLIQ